MKKKLTALLLLAACLATGTTAYALSPAEPGPPLPPDPESVQAVVLEQCVMGSDTAGSLRVHDGDVIVRCLTYTNPSPTEPWSGRLVLADPALIACGAAVSGAELDGACAVVEIGNLPGGASYKILAVMAVPEGGPGFTDWTVTGGAYGANGSGAVMTVQDTHYGDPDLKAEHMSTVKDLVIRFRNDSEKATGGASCIRTRIRFHGLDEAGKKAVKDAGGVLLEDGRYEFAVGGLAKGGRIDFRLEGLKKYVYDKDIEAVYGGHGLPEEPVYIAPAPIE